MSKDKYDELMKRLPEIAKTVNAFNSEKIQLLAFKMLVGDIDIEGIHDETDDSPPLKKKKQRTKSATKNQERPKGGTTKTKKSSALTMDKSLNLKPKGKKSITDFMDEKCPSSVMEKSTACVYFLRNELEIAPVTENHVYTCFKRLGWRIPKDLRNMMAQAASKQGWIDTSDYADIKVTPHGENLVEHDLPKKKDDK
jgi:hypothetical protein